MGFSSQLSSVSPADRSYDFADLTIQSVNSIADVELCLKSIAQSVTEPFAVISVSRVRSPFISKSPLSIVFVPASQRDQETTSGRLSCVCICGGGPNPSGFFFREAPMVLRGDYALLLLHDFTANGTVFSCQLTLGQCNFS